MGQGFDRIFYIILIIFHLITIERTIISDDGPFSNMEISEQTKQQWKKHGKNLFWNCPECEDVEMVQYRFDDHGGIALCPECLAVYHPDWEIAEPSPLDM